jgi:excisionase family DNA binding protein
MLSLLTIDDVANRLGVTPRYVRRLVAERRIPFVKCGHLVRFESRDVEAWIRDRRIEVDVRRAGARGRKRTA